VVSIENGQWIMENEKILILKVILPAAKFLKKLDIIIFS